MAITAATLHSLPQPTERPPSIDAELWADDWAILVATLHHSGEHRLPHQRQFGVRWECDGFGELPDRHGGDVDTMLWDWSHVRDSSPLGIERAAFFARWALIGLARCATEAG